MGNETRKQFINSLDTGLKRQKKLLKVGIVDDMADKLEKEIKSEIECIVRTLSLEDFEKKSPESFNTYDILFIDATYDNSRTDTITEVERLIKKEPELRDKIMIIIGTDVIDWGRHNDPYIKKLVSRVQRLPNIIYGKPKGTKVELMIKHMQSIGKKKNIEVPKKLPKGVCDAHLLEQLTSKFEKIETSINEQRAIGLSIIEQLEGFEPKNEDERRIIARALELARLIKENGHIIVQVYYQLSGACRIAEANSNQGLEDGSKASESKGIEGK